MSKARRKKNDILKRKRRKQLSKEAELTRQMSIIRLVSMLVLRNNGWGTTRLIRFNVEFNEILKDVNDGLLTFEDIFDTLEEEADLDLSNIWVK